MKRKVEGGEGIPGGIKVISVRKWSSAPVVPSSCRSLERHGWRRTLPVGKP